MQHRPRFVRIGGGRDHSDCNFLKKILTSQEAIGRYGYESIGCAFATGRTDRMGRSVACVVVFSGGIRPLLRSVRCPVRSGSGLVSDRGVLRKSGPFERAVVRYDDGRSAAARAEGYGRFLPETDRPDHRSVDLLVDRPADSVFCLFELYSAA